MQSDIFRQLRSWPVGPGQVVFTEPQLLMICDAADRQRASEAQAIADADALAEEVERHRAGQGFYGCWTIACWRAMDAVNASGALSRAAERRAAKEVSNAAG